MTTTTAPNLGKSFTSRTSRPATDEDIAMLTSGDWISERGHPWSWQFKRWDGEMCIGTWEGKEFPVPRHLLTVCTVVDDVPTKFHKKSQPDSRFKVGDRVRWHEHPNCIYEIIKPEKGGHVTIELTEAENPVKPYPPNRKRVALWEIEVLDRATLRRLEALKDSQVIDKALEQRLDSLKRLKIGCRYWDSKSNRFGKFAGETPDGFAKLVNDRSCFTACPTDLWQASLWEGLRVRRARWGDGVIDRWHPYTGGWWIKWDKGSECACQDNLLTPLIEVGDKFALNPGATQEFEVKAIAKGEKPYHIKWTYGPDEVHQVDVEFFRKFKRIKRDVKDYDTSDGRWNPDHFGKVPHQIEESGQATIFYDTSNEPPCPEDFATIEEYEAAWQEWEQNQPLSQSEGFWRARSGLHPTIKPSNPKDDRFIRCDTLPVEDQIKLCNDRIAGQQWRIDDLMKNSKAGKSRDNAVASAESAITSEQARIDELLEQLIIYRQFLDLGLDKDEAKIMALRIIADQTPQQSASH